MGYSMERLMDAPVGVLAKYGATYSKNETKMSKLTAACAQWVTFEVGGLFPLTSPSVVSLHRAAEKLEMEKNSQGFWRMP